jgi:hypothetical protein
VKVQVRIEVLVARETSPSLFGKIMALCSEAGFSPQIAATAVVWSSVVLLVEQVKASPSCPPICSREDPSATRLSVQ